ncbi:MAG: 1-acyl-sn-glycerol-3-phosphate acyltransferase, partial [Actinomycetota bacterium]
MTRRFLSISAIFLALPLWVVSAPVWLTLTILADVVGRLWRFPTVRLGLFTGVYLTHEWAGTLAAGALWLRGGFGRRLDRDAHRALQGWWANSLLRWAGRLLGVEIEPIDLDGLPTDTFILLSRHASMADAVLPAAVVAGPMGRFVHYVLKRELQWDPALDIVGSRLGNHFVARDGDTANESAAIERLADQAEPASVLVIFPEGTYATPESRARIVASLRRKGADEAAARAEKLQQLLPPRPAGTLAMLRSQPTADVVVLGH